MTRSTVEHPSLECAECSRTVDEFTAISEKWRYWSDGRELVAFCPECAQREFAHEAPASEEHSVGERRSASRRL